MSASEIPSTSKIKVKNLKNVSLDKSNVLKERMAKDLSMNEDPVFRKTYLDTLSKKGYDINELNRYADAVQSKSGIERYVAGDQQVNADEQERPTPREDIYNPILTPIENAIDKYISGSGEHAGAGAMQVFENLKKLSQDVGTKGMLSGKSFKDKLGDVGTDALNVGAGTVKTAFAVGGLVSPQLAAFNVATEAVLNAPDEVKSSVLDVMAPGNQGLSKEQKVENFDKTIQFPFAAASTIADMAGYHPEEGSAGLATLEILNILIPVIGHRVGTGLNERIKSVEDLKAIQEKISKNEATEQEVKDYATVSKEMENMSVDDVKNSVKIDQDELHTKLADLEATVSSEGFAKLPPEVQEGIKKDIASTVNQIAVEGQKKLDAEMNEASDIAKVAELEDKITQSEAALETAEGPVKESIQKVIDELKTQRDAVQIRKPEEILQREQGEAGKTGSERTGVEPVEQGAQAAEKVPTKEEVIDKLIEDAIEEGDFERGSLEEGLARKSLSKRFDDQVELDNAMKEVFRAEEDGPMPEPVRMNKKLTYKTAKNEYTVEPVNGELVIRDKNGKSPSAGTLLKITKDYEQRFDYKQGKSAFEGIEPGEIQPSEANKLIAEKSENPQEIIDAHEQLMADEPFVQGEAIDHAISENIGKVKRQGYIQFGDRNNVTQGKAKAYFDKEGETVDTLAQRISEETGLDVTPNDVISFIDRFPNGLADYNRSLKNPLIADLKARFKKITGLTLNDRVIEASLSKEEREFINDAPETYEEFRKAFDHAIETGQLKEHPKPETKDTMAEEVTEREAPPVKNPPKERTVPAPKEEGTTGTKQAVVNAEREAEGLDPIEKSMREPNEERWDRVKAEVRSGEVDPKAIAESVINEKRPVSADEVVALDYHRINLQNKRDAIMKAIEKAQEKGEMEAETDNLLRLEEVNAEIDLNDHAAFISSSEWGRSGQMRQRMFKKDYSMVALERKAKIVNGGKPLPKETTEKLQKLSEEIEAQRKVIDELQQEKVKKEAQAVIDELAIEEKVQAGIEAESQKIAEKFFGKETRAKVEKSFDDILSMLDGGAAFSSVVPLPVLKAAVKLVKNLVLRGMDLTNAVKAGIDYIRDNHKDEFKEEEFIGLFNPLKEHVKTKPGKSHSTEGILSAARKRAESKGRLPGLTGLLKKYVGEGVKEIDDMVDLIYADFKDHIPNLTKREVRDEISGYGKVTELSQDAINVSLRKLKRIGSLMSALEDAHQNRIKRTGLQRDLPSAEEIALRKQINAAMRENQIAKAENPRSESEWKSLLDKYKSRLEKKTEELQDKMDRGDYSKKVKVPLILDAEAIAAKKKFEQLKDKAAKEIKILEDKNKTRGERWKDNFLKFRRAMILSSLTTTLGKLGVAASGRSLIINPMEAVISAAWSKMPFIREIANKSPRYGGPFSPKAIAENYAEFFSKETWKDAWQTLKGDAGELTHLYGHDKEPPPGLLDIFNYIHKSIKTPPKRAEFKYSLQKRMEHAIRNGENPYDPVLQSKILAEAYEDGNRAIFMQKNVHVQGYQAMLKRLENAPAGKATAFIMNFLLPIIKVPTNYAAERSEYLIGGRKLLKLGGKAISETIKNTEQKKGMDRITTAVEKVVEGLTPEQADAVMRGFTRNSVGAGLFLIGYFGYENFGGYYRKGQKDRDAKPEDMTIAGIHIPHWAQHIAALGNMQFGATIRRTQEYYAKMDEKLDPGEEAKGNTFMEGLGLATIGEVSKVPFLETQHQVVEALQTPEGQERWVAELAKSLAIPPDLQKIAKWMDTDLNGDEIKRKPKGFLEVLKMGIPGMRETVGTAFDELMSKRTSPTSDQVLLKQIQEADSDEERKALQEELQSNREDRRKERTDKEVETELELMELAKALGKEYVPPKGQTIREKMQLEKMIIK